MRHDELRSAEDVDDVERPGLGNGLGKGPERRNREDAPLVRVDRYALESLVDEIAEDTERRTPFVRRRPDDGNPSSAPENRLDLGVASDLDRSAVLGEIEVGDRPRPVLASGVPLRIVAQVAPSLV